MSEREYNLDVCPECKVREEDSSKKKLYRCKHCERWFCVKHLEPKLAVIRDFKATIKDTAWRNMVEKEGRRKDGHPDYSYTLEKLNELKIEREIIRAKMEVLLGKSKAYRKPIPKETKKERKLYFVKEESPSYKPKHGWKQRPKLKINIFGIVGGVLALISLILPWWYFQISTSILGVSASTSITVDLYKATFSATIWGEGGQIPYVAEFPMDMWFGLLASSFIILAAILAIVGGLTSGKIGKAILVLAGILILSSIIVYAYGLQNELPKLTEDLHNYPYNLKDFPEVQLFSSGAYSHPTYPIPAWNYSSYLYLGFWMDLIATVLIFISANMH